MCALRDPEPRYFEEILRNSLSDDKIRQFCADFLLCFALKNTSSLCHVPLGHRTVERPVFLLRYSGIRTARVTKAMIDNLTEVIFLEQAYLGFFDIDN